MFRLMFAPPETVWKGVDALSDYFKFYSSFEWSRQFKNLSNTSQIKPVSVLKSTKLLQSYLKGTGYVLDKSQSTHFGVNFVPGIHQFREKRKSMNESKRGSRSLHSKIQRAWYIFFNIWIHNQKFITSVSIKSASNLDLYILQSRQKNQLRFTGDRLKRVLQKDLFSSSDSALSG